MNNAIAFVSITGNAQQDASNNLCTFGDMALQQGVEVIMDKNFKGGVFELYARRVGSKYPPGVKIAMDALDMQGFLLDLDELNSAFSFLIDSALKYPDDAPRSEWMAPERYTFTASD